MELSRRDWFVFSAFGIAVFAVSTLHILRIQPPSKPHNKQLSDVDPQDCAWNSIKDIKDDVDTFLSCFKVFYADRNANESKDRMHLSACVTYIVGNISMELYLLQITNDSDYERLSNTREKLFRTYRELEACVLKSTEREECPCLQRFHTAVLDKIKLLGECFHEHYRKSVISRTIVNTYILGSLFLCYCAYTFTTHALPKQNRLIKAGVSLVFSVLYLSVSLHIYDRFLNNLMPYMLGYPPFAGRIVHVDLDEIMGRQLNSLKSCDMEELKWRYPGEDACIHCIASFLPYAHWVTSTNISEIKIVWLLNGKPASFSRRHSLVLNETKDLSDGSFYVSRVVRISNLKKSDFGKYECTPDWKTLSTYWQNRPSRHVEIQEIPSKRVNIPISPGSVLRIHFSHANYWKNLGHWANFSLSMNNRLIVNKESMFPSNVRSCSAVTAFLDLLIVAVKGLGHPSGDSQYADMVTLCVSFQHYGVHQLHLERLINGVRATSRHPVSIEVTRRLGDKVASGQVQTSDEDLQNGYSILREVFEIVVVFALLGVHDVIRLIFTALVLWAFFTSYRFVSPFLGRYLANDATQACNIYVVSSEVEKGSVQRFVVDFLESSGHEVYFHDRDCPLGTPHMTSIRAALPSHRKFIVVVSEHFFSDRLCCHQWDVISDELAQRRTSIPICQASNQLLIIRSGDTGLPSPAHGAHIIQWKTNFKTVDATAQTNATWKMYFNHIILSAWVNEWLFPEVSLKGIFYVSFVVTFSNPTILMLLPYWSELCDIFWSLLQSV